jgi:hypothetical protein
MRRNPVIAHRVTATNLISRTSHQQHKFEGTRLFRFRTICDITTRSGPQLTLLVWHLVAQGLAGGPAAAN